MLVAMLKKILLSGTHMTKHASDTRSVNEDFFSLSHCELIKSGSFLKFSLVDLCKSWMRTPVGFSMGPDFFWALTEPKFRFSVQYKLRHDLMLKKSNVSPSWKLLSLEVLVWLETFSSALRLSNRLRTELSSRSRYSMHRADADVPQKIYE